MKLIARTICVLGAMIATTAFFSTRAAAQDGAAVYNTKCAVCHGADGNGGTPMGKKLGVKPFSSPDVAKNTDATWTEITKKGKGKMPAYESKLKEDEIKSLLTYMRGLAKGK